MITSIDTNVISVILEGIDREARISATIIDRVAPHGPVIVAPIVYAELLAGTNRSPGVVEAFLRDSPVRVDWTLSEAMWRDAGMAYRDYATRRHSHSEAAPRRILADFLIGSHSMHRQATLLTWDDAIFTSYFPTLTVVTPA